MLLVYRNTIFVSVNLILHNFKNAFIISSNFLIDSIGYSKFRIRSSENEDICTLSFPQHMLLFLFSITLSGTSKVSQPSELQHTIRRWVLAWPYGMSLCARIAQYSPTGSGGSGEHCVISLFMRFPLLWIQFLPM